MGRLQDMHVMGGGCGIAVHITEHMLIAYSTACFTRWHTTLLPLCTAAAPAWPAAG
jgi:hypothetical protein